MFLLRRTAVRAISATPSKAFFAQPRSITSITPAALRLRQQQWSIASFQRRFASDEAAKTESAEAAAAEAENFAQTAAEAPVEENLTPAQQEVQAEPTDAAATVDADALEQAAREPRSDRRASRSGRDRDQAPVTPGKTLYVGNLYYEVTADQLKRVFSRFGNIDNVTVVYDNRGLSRGFGYVEFKSVADAQAAVDNLDMQVFEGRNLVVQFHRAKTGDRDRKPRTNSSAPNTPSRTLFIGNMSFEMSDKDLNNLFREIRNVVDVRVAIDRRTGQPRGFAHADFIDVASAERAKEMLAGKSVYGRELRIDFSKPTGGESKRSDSTQE
ncbi:RNA-binding domain-containing protein [Plenodomus tracheiphilus IPT5]|uniref:RNA-binding domain-containing protein n=1 Tax=Plenodomus tracheiphilus IPT5 TaxID=1408161 RepID=A0A6A7B5A1_9PLEO|nr:RNA-binding domain-containing protein [Plenodomus tracheiphilus IPT5]